MTLYETIRAEITARQAAEMYGLKISRNGRGFCPWHDDGKHPALNFFDKDRRCYCHVCHNGGNAIALTSQILGVSYRDAAAQIAQDFHLSGYDDYMPRDQYIRIQKQIKAKRDLKSEFDKRWIYLSDVVHEAENKLKEYTVDTADERFTMILGAMAYANDELNYMWEVGYDGKTG